MGNGMGRSTSGGNEGGRRRDMSPPPDEELEFLTTFQRQYGTNHPFFYSCRLGEALSIADEERKFVFMYIHSPNHPFSSSFCKDTLCCEPVVQFLDENFISWGALFDRGQGLQIASSVLRPATFPCCAVVAPAVADNINVLQQMEGPMSPQQLLEMLQRAVDEHGLAFGHFGAKERKRGKARAMEADEKIRAEQDSAYHAALITDQFIRTPKVGINPVTKKPEQEKGKSKNQKPEQKRGQKSANNNNQFGRPVVPSTVKRQAQKSKEETVTTTQIVIRFPNGERREQKFSSSDKVQSVFRYINSLSLSGTGKYRLVSSFPRRVYGADQSGMSLKDVGLHPKATLFLEPI